MATIGCRFKDLPFSKRATSRDEIGFLSGADEVLAAFYEAQQHDATDHHGKHHEPDCQPAGQRVRDLKRL